MPNRDSTRWFFSSVWDTILKTSPGAHVHVFGGGRTPSNSAPATSWHGTPSESIEMFHSDSILVVPLRVASGIRMKILEAWARGVPVVATPEAVRGLAGSDGQAFLLARSGVEFASAVRRIHLEPELRRRLVVAGRRVLETHHDPTTISETLEFAYLEASERPSSIS
jgi:glycosyltransferase involved in cell wall biosynthesis